ncbi:MAG: cation:proton antiporter, partial [Clostridia bacterium]|nr:cation:proton antiporter [Clostridia bacterium]
PSGIIEGMDFLADIALAFIAFGMGEFFKFDLLKKNGPRVVLTALLEATLASVLVFVLTYFVLKLNFAFCIVVSALASATAPASTMMTIRQLGAKGNFVNTLLQVVAIDNIVGLLAYSVAISVALSTLNSSAIVPEDILEPVLINLGVLVLGGLFGLFMKLLIQKKRSNDNRLIIAIALLFGFCGICTILDISPLLGCMSMGMIYINVSGDDKLFKQLNYFSPPLMLLFFVRSGLSFRLDSLISPAGSVGTTPLLVIGIAYFFVRIIGKYIGAFVGSIIAEKPASIRNNLGLALIPQAGVAIPLAAMGARAIGGDLGDAMETVILSSSILYELVGPALAKLSLYWSGACTNDIEKLVEVDTHDENGRVKSEVELLVERIQKIQSELPEHSISEEEQAFTSAAEEQYEQMTSVRRRRFNRR